MQDLILEKVLDLLAESSEDYIPKIGTLQNDLRKLKTTFETDMKNLRQQLGAAGGNANEDISRIEIDALRRNISQLDHILTEKIN